MRKILSVVIASIMIVSVLFQTQVQAAPAISIYINGVKLSTDQAPMMIKNRAMLPLRAIFEALDAKVLWNQKTKTVTAMKDGTTIVLKLGSKTATINNVKVQLDVPAQAKKGRTMVPVRFVSEAMGDEVVWNKSTSSVFITTSAPDESVSGVSYVTAQIIGQSGDGRDLRVSFARPTSEVNVDHYRVLIVKSANTSAFNIGKASAVSANNYTRASVGSQDSSITLSAQSRDVDGELISANKSYTAFVLTVAKGSGSSELSNPSAVVTVGSNLSVLAVNSVAIRDASDYGDGRDLSVTFTKPTSDGNIANYRVLVVKTSDASKFTFAIANNVASQNYTSVTKSGSTMTTTLTSSSKDTSGEVIKSNVSYTVFVLSVSNIANVSNKLSSASTSITLTNNSITTPVITSVTDVSNYGDGRDLRINFNKIVNESTISAYRILVVKANNASSFNLTAANAVGSSNYTQLNKTGSNISQVLASNARDVNGASIQNGVSYKIFVLAVGTGSYSGINTLSAGSSAITLTNNNTVQAVTNISVNDVNDYYDGRDLSVAFSRASDEPNINHYRVMIVPSSNSSSFNLAAANAVNSTNFTQVNKTGYNLTQILSSNTRDVYGSLIKNGVSYRVFVLSVGNGSLGNVLSSASSVITLSNNNNVTAVTHISVSDVNDYGDGRDLSVAFNRASDESNISHYRVIVVPNSYANSFNLAAANVVSSANYTQVNKTGYNLTQILASNARDVYGSLIQNSVSYRVFVLSVSNGSSSNALSSSSSAISLSLNPAIAAPTNVAASIINNFGDGRDIEVTFNKASNETYISEYRIMVVRADSYGGFNLSVANSVTSGKYTRIVKQGTNIRQALSSTATDTSGNVISRGVPYRVFVLSVSDGRVNTVNALSAVSGQVSLSAAPVTVAAVTYLAAARDINGNITVYFDKVSDQTNVASYTVLAVKGNTNMDVATANQVSANAIIVSTSADPRTTPIVLSVDTEGKAFEAGVPYSVYVVTVAKNSGTSAISSSFVVN